MRASLLRKPDTDSDNEEEQEVDPKIKKELEEISKIHDSPMADVIRQDLTLQVWQHKTTRICVIGPFQIQYFANIAYMVKNQYQGSLIPKVATHTQSSLGHNLNH